MDSEKRTPREIQARRTNKLMRRLSAGFRVRLDEELRSREVTTSQLRLLHEIRERPGSSGAQLARACYVTPQSAQAMLVRAVRRGWAVRGKDAANERLVTARLTPAGQRLLSLANTVLTRLEAEVWAGTPVTQLRQMNDILERGLTNLGEES